MNYVTFLRTFIVYDAYHMVQESFERLRDLMLQIVPIVKLIHCYQKMISVEENQHFFQKY